VPREVVDAPPLAVFKVRLDAAFKHPDLVKDVPAHRMGVGLFDL